MPKLDTLARVAELSVDAARHAGSLALTVARRVAEPILEHQRARSAEPAPAPAEARPDPPDAPIESVARPEPVTPAPTPAPAPAPEPDAPEPAHVDREAVVVAESADPGARGGVGAQIRVGEPWPGYAELNVKQVSAQLADASAETLAIARLHESVNRNRKGVLAAIDRRLAAISG